MTSFKDHLLSAEEDFLSALIGGGDAILAFEQHWESLLEDIGLAVDAGSLDDETSAMAHTIALRIAMLSDTSVDVFSSCDSFTSQLMEQMETLVSELSLADHTHSVPTTPPSPRPRPHLPSDTECRKGKKRCRSSSHFAQGKRRRTRTEDIPPPCARVITNTAHEEASLSLGKKRKRCASDADASPTHPHAKRLHVGPRLHAASDSFLMARSSPSELVGTSLPPLPLARPTHFDSSLPVDIHPMIEASEWQESFTLSPPTMPYERDLGYASSNLLTELPQISDLDAFFCSWQPSIAALPSPQTSFDSIGESLFARELSPPGLSRSGPSTPADSPTPNRTPSPQSRFLAAPHINIADDPSPPYHEHRWHDEELDPMTAQMSGPCDLDTSSNNTLKTSFTYTGALSLPSFVESTIQPGTDCDPSILLSWALAPPPYRPSTPGAPIPKDWLVLPLDDVRSFFGEAPNSVSEDGPLLSVSSSIAPSLVDP